MQITVKVNDKGNVMQGIHNMGRAIPEISQTLILNALGGAMESSRKYPARPAGSTYERTNKYFDSFEVIPSGALGGRLTSDAVSIRGRHYTVFVGGDSSGEGQSYNTGHWSIIKKQVDDIIPLLVTALKTAIEEAFVPGRAGGLATLAKYGKGYFAKIGRLGGLASAKHK